VLDASFAMEVLTGAEAYRDAWGEWVGSGITVLVPAHFWAEVGNALLLGAGISALEASARLERFAAAGPDVADRGADGVRDALALAERHRLTVYDALYLQLALDVEGEIATLDRPLSRAAKASGVPLVRVRS